jgi:hypothetical protein
VRRVACTAGQVCNLGNCTSTCDAALTKCGASCVDVSTDNQNGGGCDLACNGGTICKSGKCECPAGTTLCNGLCVDTTRDRANCGGCGAAFACPQFKACVGSSCVCTDTRPDCDGDGVCHDLRSDNAHCGECNRRCDGDAGLSCKGGQCK